MKRYEIETYTSSTGKAPFEAWVRSLKDSKAKLAILARIERAEYGDFGDWKAIAGTKGVFEMRIHYAQGFRIYYSIVGQRIVVLLAGSTKQEQDRTIARAIDYLDDYNRSAR
jgi:putative addiction module killer protein